MSVCYGGRGILLTYFCVLYPMMFCSNDVIFQRKPGRYLGSCVIRTVKAKHELECCVKCLNEPECVSVNFKFEGKDKDRCELNWERSKESPEQELKALEYIYLGIMERVRNIQ